MVKQVFLDYDFTVFLNADYSSSQSSLAHLPDIYPPTINEENTQIEQVWWDDSQVDFELIGSQLNMLVVSVSSIQQRPGMLIPTHQDSFHKVSTVYPDDKRLKVRANIFLQSWMQGHTLHFDHVQAEEWEAGEGYLWDSSVYHLSSNAGFYPKYTLQISGFSLA